MSKIHNELSKDFEVLPRDLIFDSSLSDRARFVYCFMASKPADWDFYLAPMANELNYSVDTLRKYIKELVDSGWLEKGEQNILEQNRFGSVEYIIKAKSPTRKKSDTEKVRHGKNPTQHNRDNIENRDEEENRDKEVKKKKKFDFRSAIISLGVDENICDDWLQVRKSKKASNTETAFNGVCKQILISGLPANECIRIAAENSWQGFKAEWLNKNTNTNGQTNSNSSDDKRQRMQGHAETFANMLAQVERNRADGKFGRGTDEEELCW